MTFVILATGESMSQAVADSVKRYATIAVSNAYELAPRARALVSADAAWWLHYLPVFEGRRFCLERVPGTERFAGVDPGWNSGALAVRIAREVFGAKKIVLLGFDGHGTHYFGKHPELKVPRPLRNTNVDRRRHHMKQHRIEAAACAAAGVEIWNCTPGTAIDAYPVSTLEAIRC